MDVHKFLMQAARDCMHPQKVPVEESSFGGTLCLGCAEMVLSEILSQETVAEHQLEIWTQERRKGLQGFERLVLMLGDESISKESRKELTRALRLLGVIPTT